MKIPEMEILEIKRTYNARSSSEAKAAVVAEAAERYGVHPTTIYRKIQVKKFTKTPRPDIQAKWSEHERWATQIFDFAKLNSKDDKNIKMNKAFKYFQKYQGMPEDITMKNIYEAQARLHLKNQSIHCPGHWREKAPRDLYHVDFSVSRYIKHEGNGIVRITNDRWTRKDSDGNRLWFGGVIDDHSNVMYYEYFLTPGESALVAQDLILNAMRRKDSHFHLQGIPKRIYIDRGPGFKNETFKAGLNGIGIKVQFGDDLKDRYGNRTNVSNKGAHGKIERMHQVVKNDFEQELLLGLLDNVGYKAGDKLSLAELNAIMFDWVHDRNDDYHPEFKGAHKWTLFKNSLSDQDFLPDDARSLFANTFTRKVDQRRVRISANKWYKVPDWVGEGETISITSIADAHWILDADGGRHMLNPVQGSVLGDEPAIKVQHERKSDTLPGGVRIRDRFDIELRSLTAGAVTLEGLDEALYGMIKYWFDQDRTIEEIKSRASYIAMRALDMLKEESAALQQQQFSEVGVPKIITMPGSMHPVNGGEYAGQ